ncbi:S49 family peptidase [Myxococcota bacterium]|nr:S49 family peptidase [Myxococcota bacterium]
MLLRWPVLLIWNLLRTIFFFPFNVIRTFFPPKTGRLLMVNLRETLPRWHHLSLLQRWRGEALDLTLDEWRESLEAIGRSNRVKGIVCTIEHLQADWPALEELRIALQKFRDTGKSVAIVPKQLTLSEVYLATAADKLVISPAAPVFLHSPALAPFFFGEMLQHLGIKPDFIQQGKHKNAPELFTRAYPSATNRQDLDELIADYRALCFERIAKSKQRTTEEIAAIFDRGVFSPQEALQSGLIDAIRFPDHSTFFFLEGHDKQPYPSPEDAQKHLLEETERRKKRKHRKKNKSRASASSQTSPAEQAEPSTERACSETDKSSEEAEVVEASKSSEEAEVVEASKSSEEAEVVEASKTPEDAKAVESSKTSESTDVKESVEGSKKAEAAEAIEDEDLPLMDLDEFLSRQPRWLRWTRLRRTPTIAILPIVGTIQEEETPNPVMGGEEAASSNRLTEIIDELCYDPSVKGVVALIDSRGGAATASEAIWYALRRLSEEKPVVAFLESYAASGGYYVACGTERIISSPWCLTGSIGVFGGKFIARDLFQRLRIHQTEIGGTEGSRLFSVTHDPTEADIARRRGQMEEAYEQFVGRVAVQRRRSRDEIHALAQGKVYFGFRALEHKLVDACGGLDDAVAWAQKRSKSAYAEPMYVHSGPAFSLRELMSARASLQQPPVLPAALASLQQMFPQQFPRHALAEVQQIIRLSQQHAVLLWSPLPWHPTRR